MVFRGQDGLTCRAEALFRPIVYGQVPGYRDAVILKGQVGGLVPLVVGAAQGHRREQVKAYLAVGLGIFNRCTIFSWLQLVCIKAWEKSDMAGYEMLIFSAEIRWPHTSPKEKPLALCYAASNHIEKLYCSAAHVICCIYSGIRSWALCWFLLRQFCFYHVYDHKVFFLTINNVNKCNQVLLLWSCRKKKRIQNFSPLPLSISLPLISFHLSNYKTWPLTSNNIIILFVSNWLFFLLLNSALSCNKEIN